MRNMKMKQQYQTRYELLHESYQKWLTGFTRHAVSWGVCHPNIYYFHNLFTYISACLLPKLRHHFA
ncbi:hypothetical protein CO715_25005 [Escherichia coli M12]|nr:hypothetical protein CO715_25005 [Escherichia coli M12]